MHIRRRRGSIALESVMVLPVGIIMILLTRFLLEASLNRQEVGVFTRSATHVAAGAESTDSFYCDADGSAFEGRANVSQTPKVTCARRDAEQGLRREDPFWRAVDEGASAWREILRDVKPTGTPYDMTGQGDASLKLSGSEFLSQQTEVIVDQGHIAPMGFWWNHTEGAFDRGHDQVIWEELRKSETYRLFPEVFPKR